VSSLSVVIDAMVPADLDAAVTIDLAAFRPSEHGMASEDPRTVREQQLRDELARAYSHVRVARGDGAVVVGYSLFWHVVDEIHLLNVAVAPHARRRGIGRILMDDLLAYARANEASKVLLEVRASNVAAIGLYERLGFERFNVREQYYADGEDAVEMWLLLGPSAP
jgi:ribosomal-protein-alanine N-acetyltransferase